MQYNLGILLEKFKDMSRAEILCYLRDMRQELIAMPKDHKWNCNCETCRTIDKILGKKQKYARTH